MACIGHGDSSCASLSACCFPVWFRRQPGSLPASNLPLASVSPCRTRRNVVIDFLPIALELSCANGRRVLGEHSLTRRHSNLQTLRFAQIAENTEHVVRALGQEHFFPDFENAVESFPPVTDDGGPAGPSFEQSNAWRITGKLHCLARNVKREP